MQTVREPCLRDFLYCPALPQHHDSLHDPWMVHIPVEGHMDSHLRSFLIFDGDFLKPRQLHGMPMIRTRFHGLRNQPVEPALLL